jgi:putative membrane protein
MAGGSDMFEIQSSKLAAEKSKNSGVKDLAQMLIKDHTKSTADLKAAAAKATPAITVNPKMTAEQEANLTALKAAGESDFDRTYLDQQVMAHQKALQMVQGYSAAGTVDSLKEHASAVAGPIQQHLERAQSLQSQSGGATQ